MSHEILQYDTQQGRAMAWHNLTQVLPELDLSASQFGPNGWEYVASQMFNADGGELPWRFLTASDLGPGIPLGKPYDPKTFTVFSNEELRNVLADIETAGAKLESCGTIQNRARRFFSFRLGDTFKSAGRDHQSFLAAIDAVDGTSRLQFFLTTTCIVCANTWRAAIETKGKTFATIKHCKNAKAQLADVPALFEQYFAQSQAYAHKLDALANVSISMEQAKGFLSAWLAGGLTIGTAKNEAPKLVLAKNAGELLLSRRSLNRVERIGELFKAGAGNRGENLADLFNGVTDYFTHESAGGEDMAKQFESSEFGAGAKDKAEFFDFLTIDTRTQDRNAICDTGNRIAERSLVELAKK